MSVVLSAISSFSTFYLLSSNTVLPLKPLIAIILLFFVFFFFWGGGVVLVVQELKFVVQE